VSETVVDAAKSASKAVGETFSDMSSMGKDLEKDTAHAIASTIMGDVPDAKTIQQKREAGKNKVKKFLLFLGMKISQKGAKVVDEIMGSKVNMEKSKDIGIDQTGIPKTMDLDAGEITIGETGVS
jgi:hypothetical protein